MRKVPPFPHADVDASQVDPVVANVSSVCVTTVIVLQKNSDLVSHFKENPSIVIPGGEYALYSKLEHCLQYKTTPIKGKANCFLYPLFSPH
jgi:hypothetical protein